MGGYKWTIEEKEIIQTHWEHESDMELLKLLPDRTYWGVAHKRIDMGLIRTIPNDPLETIIERQRLLKGMSK